MADDRLGGRRSTRTPTGRVPFVWVQDDTTGHRYDVPENAIRAGMTPVPDYPKNTTGRARPAVFRTDLAGESTTPQQPAADEAAEQPTAPPADTGTSGRQAKTKQTGGQ
ncbi:hypothetical protein QQG74_09615 [Micromonospora sp. FIMYZ51]|uniref:hypothetical protein n=1 Tax=Micromonospora sp. FIMYZ51 TaxID=3051832 RepID=UPI00311ED764